MNSLLPYLPACLSVASLAPSPLLPSQRSTAWACPLSCSLATGRPLLWRLARGWASSQMRRVILWVCHRFRVVWDSGMRSAIVVMDVPHCACGASASLMSAALSSCGIAGVSRGRQGGRLPHSMPANDGASRIHPKHRMGLKPKPFALNGLQAITLNLTWA